ncbi:MAG: carbonic anhydrase family protein, partial [Betaproteobacteria bacterium]
MNHPCPTTSAARRRWLQALIALGALCHATIPWASESALANPTRVAHGSPPRAGASATAQPESSETAPVIDIRRDVRKQLKDAIEQSKAASSGNKPTVTVNHGAKGASAGAQVPAEASSSKPQIPAQAKSKAATHSPRAKAGDLHGPAQADRSHGEVHWSYEGETGPQAWGQLKSEFNVCAIGKRQSPIHIEEGSTLQGPAEPLQIDYAPSKGSVVNNGHTIQVDLEGDNSITVRGSVFKLVQMHFHHPAEEKVNYKGFAMVAHLVHRNAVGELAVLAVLFDPGEASPLIQKIWTRMPLDVNDRVALPEGIIDLNEILPKDRRYYQFLGSLTTPPCTEGVLWLILKEPMTLAREQLRLFAQV